VRTPARPTVARDSLIERHLPLVRALAWRYAGGPEPVEDLFQVGAIGLIKAVDRYDPARGGPLEPYAAAVIAGEIRHHLRDRCAPVRLPRRLRHDGVVVRFEPLAAVDEPTATADPVATVDDRLALARAVRCLHPRARRLFALRYVAGLSQAQAAAALGLSRVHAARLLREALATLRDELSEPAAPPPAEAAVASGRARG
jgi:RNA polymerase sigma-B factor